MNSFCFGSVQKSTNNDCTTRHNPLIGTIPCASQLDFNYNLKSSMDIENIWSSYTQPRNYFGSLSTTPDYTFFTPVNHQFYTQPRNYCDDMSTTRDHASLFPINYGPSKDIVNVFYNDDSVLEKWGLIDCNNNSVEKCPAMRALTSRKQSVLCNGKFALQSCVRKYKNNTLGNYQCKSHQLIYHKSLFLIYHFPPQVYQISWNTQYLSLLFYTHVKKFSARKCKVYMNIVAYLLSLVNNMNFQSINSIFLSFAYEFENKFLEWEELNLRSSTLLYILPRIRTCNDQCMLSQTKPFLFVPVDDDFSKAIERCNINTRTSIDPLSDSSEVLVNPDCTNRNMKHLMNIDKQLGVVYDNPEKVLRRTLSDCASIYPKVSFVDAQDKSETEMVGSEEHKKRMKRKFETTTLLTRSKEGWSASLKQKKKKLNEELESKIGLYFVKHKSANKCENLYEMQIHWIENNYKLHFVKKNAENGPFGDVFEIQPVKVDDEKARYKTKLSKKTDLKLKFKKIAKSSKKSLPQIEERTKGLSKEQKQGTILLNSTKWGYETVGQEPTSTILKKLRMDPSYLFSKYESIQNKIFNENCHVLEPIEPRNLTPLTDPLVEYARNDCAEVLETESDMPEVRYYAKESEGINLRSSEWNINDCGPKKLNNSSANSVGVIAGNVGNLTNAEIHQIQSNNKYPNSVTKHSIEEWNNSTSAELLLVKENANGSIELDFEADSFEPSDLTMKKLDAYVECDESKSSGNLNESEGKGKMTLIDNHIWNDVILQRFKVQCNVPLSFKEVCHTIFLPQSYVEERNRCVLFYESVKSSKNVENFIILDGKNISQKELHLVLDRESNSSKLPSISNFSESKELCVFPVISFNENTDDLGLQNKKNIPKQMTPISDQSFTVKSGSEIFKMQETVPSVNILTVPEDTPGVIDRIERKTSKKSQGFGGYEIEQSLESSVANNIGNQVTAVDNNILDQIILQKMKMQLGGSNLFSPREHIEEMKKCLCLYETLRSSSKVHYDTLEIFQNNSESKLGLNFDIHETVPPDHILSAPEVTSELESPSLNSLQQSAGDHEMNNCPLQAHFNEECNETFSANNKTLRDVLFKKMKDIPWSLATSFHPSKNNWEKNLKHAHLFDIESSRNNKSSPDRRAKYEGKHSVGQRQQRTLPSSTHSVLCDAECGCSLEFLNEEIVPVQRSNMRPEISKEHDTRALKYIEKPLSPGASHSKYTVPKQSQHSYHEGPYFSKRPMIPRVFVDREMSRRKASTEDLHCNNCVCRCCFPSEKIYPVSRETCKRDTKRKTSAEDFSSNICFCQKCVTSRKRHLERESSRETWGKDTEKLIHRPRKRSIELHKHQNDLPHFDKRPKTEREPANEHYPHSRRYCFTSKNNANCKYCTQPLKKHGWDNNCPKRRTNTPQRQFTDPDLFKSITAQNISEQDSDGLLEVIEKNDLVLYAAKSSRETIDPRLGHQAYADELDASKSEQDSKDPRLGHQFYADGIGAAKGGQNTNDPRVGFKFYAHGNDIGAAKRKQDNKDPRFGHPFYADEISAEESKQDSEHLRCDDCGCDDCSL